MSHYSIKEKVALCMEQCPDDGYSIKRQGDYWYCEQKKCAFFISNERMIEETMYKNEIFAEAANETTP